jgi:hypothetical protein
MHYDRGEGARMGCTYIRLWDVSDRHSIPDYLCPRNVLTANVR